MFHVKRSALLASHFWLLQQGIPRFLSRSFTRTCGARIGIYFLWKMRSAHFPQKINTIINAAKPREHPAGEDKSFEHQTYLQVGKRKTGSLNLFTELARFLIIGERSRRSP